MLEHIRRSRVWQPIGDGYDWFWRKLNGGYNPKTGEYENGLNSMVPDWVPPVGVGGTLNGEGEVNANVKINGQEVFNTGNIDRSNAEQVVNQEIAQVRQEYGAAWIEASYGSQYVASNGTGQGYGNPAISWGATFAFSSPFSSNKSNVDHGGYGISFGRFTGTNTRGIYLTTMKGEGVMLSFSMDATYYNNRIEENLELDRIKGYGNMLDAGVRFGGYSLSSDGYSLFNQDPTYNAHTLSVGWGMDVGYTQWQTKTYVIPTVPWIGLLINQY